MREIGAQQAQIEGNNSNGSGNGNGGDQFNDGGGMAGPPQGLIERLKDYGQEDAFALWDELSSDERELLVKDIEVFHFCCVIIRKFFMYVCLVYGWIDIFCVCCDCRMWIFLGLIGLFVARFSHMVFFCFEYIN